MATRTPKPKLGPPIDPASPPPTATVVVEPRNDLDVVAGAKIVTAGLALDLDAAILAAAGRDGWMLHAMTALMEGQRVDGGGDQKALSTRAALVPDRMSEHRNYRSGELAWGLRSTPIVSNGQTATVRILPPLSRQAHVVKERARGVDIMTTRGAAGAAIEAAMRAAVEAMLTGRQVIHNDGETTSKEADE